MPCLSSTETLRTVRWDISGHSPADWS